MRDTLGERERKREEAERPGAGKWREAREDTARLRRRFDMRAKESDTKGSSTAAKIRRSLRDTYEESMRPGATGPPAPAPAPPPMPLPSPRLQSSESTLSHQATDVPAYPPPQWPPETRPRAKLRMFKVEADESSGDGLADGEDSA